MVHDPFDEFFKRTTKRFFKDFEKIEKEFEILKGLPRMPEFVVRRPGRVERRRGFSLSISGDGVNPPKIDVRRFGPTGRWEKVPLEIPSIRNPTVCGLVEIARGCGRGCDFCIPTL